MDLDSNLTRDIRAKSRKFKKTCGDAIGNGGSADDELNAFIRDIPMHCSQDTHA